MSSFSFGRATPRSPAAPIATSRVGEGELSIVKLTETQLCQIIYLLAEGDFTPLRWDDPQFDQERTNFLQVLADDLRLIDVVNPITLSAFIKRLLNIFARAGLLQIQLNPNGSAALKWPKNVVDADTLRDIGAWLRGVGLAGFDPAQLQGAKADQYLDTVVDCILNKRPLHVSKDASTSAVSTPRTPVREQAHTPPPTTRMSGAFCQMDEMDSRLVTDPRGRRRPQQFNAASFSSRVERRSEAPNFDTTLAGRTGAQSFDSRGRPAFTKSWASSTTSSPSASNLKTGTPLPDAIKDALDELAVLGARIYTRNSASTPAYGAAMERYQQLTRIVSQAESHGMDDQDYDEEYEQDYEDLESSANLGSISEGDIDDLGDEGMRIFAEGQ